MTTPSGSRRSVLPGYRLGGLGFLLFQRLCDELLAREAGVAPDAWIGAADGERHVLCPGGVRLPAGGHELPAPTLVAAVWVRSALASRGRLAAERLRVAVSVALQERLRTDPPPRSLLVLTNLPAGPALAGAVGHAATGVQVAVMGPAELGAALDARPWLRLRLPAVLGLRDLAGLVDADPAARSSFDVAAAQRLAAAFVPTHAYARALAVLERHHFVVMTGPPEMGKTANARMLGLALLTAGWQVHECLRPEQIRGTFDRERPQLFIADDAFGSTEYRADAAERWALELDRILRAMDARHWLVWTSRPAPLKAGLRRIHREHGVERFPRPAEVEVDASDLEPGEKAQMLVRHARARGVDDGAVAVLRLHGRTIVAHPHFTPERVRRFVGERLDALPHEVDSFHLQELIEAEIREPTQAMAESLRALPDDHRAVLVALLDVPPGPTPERELAAAARRHAPAGLPRPPAELVDRLSDHFLRVTAPTSVSWVHPSWRDLVIDDLAADADARRRFLGRCSLDGLLLALSVGGGRAGERRLPLLVADADWDLAGARIAELARELPEDALRRLLDGLAAAAGEDLDARERGELDALSAQALASIGRRLDADGEPASLPLLESWLALTGPTAAAPDPPALGATWAALLPTPDFDAGDRRELVRLDEWTRLVELLHRTAPAQLARLGFPSRQHATLERLVTQAGPAAGGDELFGQALARLARVLPHNRPLALAAARLAQPESRVDPLEDVGPASYRLSERALVERVLGDLEPPPGRWYGLRRPRGRP